MTWENLERFGTVVAYLMYDLSIREEILWNVLRKLLPITSRLKFELGKR